MQTITEQSTMQMMMILNLWIEERFNGIFLGASATRIVSVVVRDNYLLDANVLIQTIIALVNTGDAVVIQELQNEITYQWDEFLDTHNFVVEGDQVPLVVESDSDDGDTIVESDSDDGDTIVEVELCDGEELCDECEERPASRDSIYHICNGCYHTHDLEGSFICEGDGCEATGHREFFSDAGLCPDCNADAIFQWGEDSEEELPMCMVCNTNRSTCRSYNADDENTVYFCIPCRQEDSDDFKKLFSSVVDE